MILIIIIIGEWRENFIIFEQVNLLIFNGKFFQGINFFNIKKIRETKLFFAQSKIKIILKSNNCFFKKRSQLAPFHIK